MKNERNVGIDLLRILLSFAVVCTHFKYSSFPLCSVHVPAFMLLSFFYNEKMISNTDKNKIILRTKRLFIPYFWWALIYYVLEKYFFKNPDINLESLFFQLLDGRGLNLNGAMWFHFNLIILTMFVVVLFGIFKKKTAFLLISSLAVIALLLQYTNINYLVFSELRTELMYSLGRLCEMLPYAVIGMIISGFSIFDLMEKKHVEKATWIIFLISYIYLIKRGYFLRPAGFDYQGIYQILLAIMVVTIFYFIPTTKIPTSVCNVIKFISQYSMGIYCAHMIVGRNFVMYLDNRSIQRSALTDVVLIYLFSFAISFFIAKLPVKGSEKLVT